MARLKYLDKSDLAEKDQDLLARNINLFRALVHSPNAARAFSGLGGFIRHQSKADPRLRNIRVIVLTTSKAEEDVLKSYNLSAASYITKPVTFERLVDVVKTIGKYWLEIVELPPDGNGAA